MPLATPVAVNKTRFVLQHVWKTGGTELCRLVRAHGWHVPPSPGCSIGVRDGWPIEDYDLIGQETMLCGGPKFDFIPRRDSKDLQVHNVKWITILRHPYSRSLSHFYHMYSNYMRQNRSLVMEEFFRMHGGSGLFAPTFNEFIRDQQTRWHCGSDCALIPKLRQEHLRKAMDVLNKFHVVLILEDMSNPNSCTRLQMRHVLNITEVLGDVLKRRRKLPNIPNITIQRRPDTRWDDQVFPYLTERGIHMNNSVWGNESVVMAELGLHNEIDLQFYGYAQQRCDELASRMNESAATERQTSYYNAEAPTLAFLIPKSCVPKYYPWFLGIISLVVLLQLRFLRRIRSRIRWKEN